MLELGDKQKKPSFLWTNVEDRIDATFFREEYVVNLDEKFNNLTIPVFENGQIIEELTDYTANGSFASLKENVEFTEVHGIPLIRGTNIKNGSLDLSDIRLVTENTYNFLKKTKLYAGDFLFTKTGTLGNTIVWSKSYGKASLGDNVFKVEYRKNIDPYYIHAYFLTNYGKMWVERFSQGGVQQTIIKESFRKVKVPVPDHSIQSYIGNKIRKAELLREEGKLLRLSAKKVIENEALKLTDEDIKIIEKMSKWIGPDYLSSLRLDAEYYSEKFIKVERLIRKLNFQPLKNLIEEIQDGPGGWAISTNDYVSDGIPIVRGVNISEDGEFINDGYVYITEQKNEELKKTQVTSGQVLLSVRGTVGKSTVLPTYIRLANLNAAVVRIKLKENSGVDPYYLAGFFNSVVW